MYGFYNSSTIYVSQASGNDTDYNGLSPRADSFGNGPFKSIERALNSVGERRVSGFMRPITIALVDDYYTDRPITLEYNEQIHSKNVLPNSVTIMSYNGRKKVVGGIKITEWKRDTFNGVKCISAQLPKRSDGKCFDCTDLFINGVRANSTRYPESGVLRAVKTENDADEQNCDSALKTSSKWFIAHKEDLANVDGIEDATVTYYHYWIDEHSAVESYDRETGKLTMKYPSRFLISTAYSPNEHTSSLRYILENVPSMFKNKNEWYLDRSVGKVYYIPEDSNIDLDTIEAYAPTASRIFDFCGYAEEKAKDIKIRDIEILCTRSDYVSKYVQNSQTGKFEYVDDADVGFASDIQSVCYAYGAVSFKYAEGCSVENCLIHHIGTHAVDIREGCKNIRIENNCLEDLGAGGVRIFGGDIDCPDEEITENCIVRRNKIYNCGKKLAAGCGVLICHASHNEVSENEIAYLDYTGVSVGWVWGYFPSRTYGNIIKDNHIHHVGQGNLSDMGGIYLLGKQQGTVVSGNRIHDVSSAHYGGWGIYTDEGSSYITIENNVVYNTKCESFHQHYGSYNVVRNNIFALGSACVRISKNEMHDCAAFENNIFVVDSKSPCYESQAMSQIISRNNFIYSVSGTEPIMYRSYTGVEIDFESWTKEAGKDVGSVILNPGFSSLEDYDFTVSDNSPAAKLGFVPIKGFTASGK